MASKRKDLWTPKMVSELQRIAAEGKSASLIAKDLNAIFKKNLTRHSVIGKLHRLAGETKKPVPPEKRIPTQKYKRPVYSVDGVGFQNPKAKAIEFMELMEGACKFPIGEIRNGTLRFCGAPANISSGKPYCEYCFKICYQPLRA